MLMQRKLLGYAWLICSAIAFWAQSLYAEKPAAAVLSAKPHTDKAVKVELLLEVGGDLKLREKDRLRTLPMSVVGRMLYEERYLPGDSAKNEAAKNLADPKVTAQKTAQAVRCYETAEATIKIDSTTTTPKLRSDRKLITVQCEGDRTTLCCPTGPLTREELDLIDVPANSLLLDRLLPEKAVSVGDKWSHGEELIAGLLGLDAVSQTDVASELKDIDADAARIEFAGSVQGALGGVSTSIELKGRYKFSRSEGHITWIALLIEEKRSIGHVAPGTDLVARLQMKLTPCVVPEALADRALAKLPLQNDGSQEALEHTLAGGKFRFLYDRRWNVMDEQSDIVALRLVDRGELVAQCNFAYQTTIDPAKQPTLAKFQEDLQRSLGKNFGRFTHAAETTNQMGYLQYRVVAEGTVSDLPIEWIYFRLADKQGHQAVAAFTIEAGQASLLGKSDEALIATAEFVETSEASGGSSTVPTAAARVSESNTK
jgi:hypothetical protein